MNKIRQSIESIELPSELHNRSKLGIKQAKFRKRKFKKFIVLPLIATLFLAFSVGVGAATNSNINRLLSIVSPEVALLLQPLQLSMTDEGIKMEVVAAMNDDDMAVVYVTMQDLEGDRIDETLDIYDYFMSKGHSFTHEVVAYDESTKTAMIRFQATGAETLNNSKVNFSIQSFLSDKHVFDVKVNIDLNNIEQQQPTTLNRDAISGMGGELAGDANERENYVVLPNGMKNMKIPTIDFMEITNVGIIQNKFHIQTKWMQNDKDDHGYFYIVNSAGEEIHPSSISYGRDENGNAEYGHNYQEYIFNMQDIDMQDYELRGNFTTSGNLVKGNWETTFKLNTVKESKVIDFIYDFGGWRSTEIDISPLGLTVLGDGEIEQSTEMTATIRMKDGHTKTLMQTTSFTDKGQIKLKFLADEPLNMENIKSISVNGIEVDL
ncbi:hypothetical protein [Lysinibacillus sp. G4S2]|uniref:hypothetical protein n=1 Tax=Lysinibacillus sp. G4S2 TaxID=3055859 RepID=UPI0025A0CB8C|nr:hypothetical protein [Lysinibacillus sp. G4S2]MDM5245983.1 hypothetical protein [Lysinibacillus sp. G4S2]